MTSSGFILAKQVKDTANALQITLWVKTNQGSTKLVIDDELAIFFIETSYLPYALQVLQKKRIKLAKSSSLNLKTFQHQKVSALYFYTLRDFYQARDVLKLNNIKCFEDDIRPDERYLMERFITADIDYVGNDITVNGSCTHAVKKPNYHALNTIKCKSSKIKSTVHLNMLSLDIECSMSGELYCIGLYSHDTLTQQKLSKDKYQRVLMIGTPDCSDKIIPKKCEHIDMSWHKDEKALLVAFVEEIQMLDVDIFIGWNVINFDFKLLQKRCDLHHVKFAIGRDGSAPFWRSNRNNSDQHFIEIAGRVVLDGIDLLKSATYSFPSFSLDNVASTLLGIGKKVDDVDNRMDEINYNFKHDKEKLALYNLEDCRLVWLIFEKTQLLEFATLRSQLTGLAIDKVGGSVAAFTNLYLPKLHRAGYIAPNMGDGESDLVSPGGYVMDSTPGLFKNVLVLDFKSLYPSIIRSFKIDPMGLIEGLHIQGEAEPHITKSNKDVILGFDGALFSRENHFLPDIIEKLWQERDKAKAQSNAALSQAIKIIMNSFYGVLGSTGCRFFDPRLSGSITKRSHEILKTTSKWIEDKGFQVIYGDTDSLFVHVGEEKSLKESKEIGLELQNVINDKWQMLLQDKHQIKSHLEIEFETHFTQFLMPTVRGSDIGTKKRYAGLVADLTGKSTDTKLIFKGLESVRTDWTQLAKDFQQTLYLMVFNKEPFNDYIKETVAKTLSGHFDDKLIYRKRIRRKLSEYVKNVPPHVKAARLADDINAKMGKPLRYQKRGWISYYITLNGPQAVEHLNSPLDYDFYIDRQLSTVADAILPFIGTSFSQITDKQLGLF